MQATSKMHVSLINIFIQGLGSGMMRANNIELDMNPRKPIKFFPPLSPQTYTPRHVIHHMHPSRLYTSVPPPPEAAGAVAAAARQPSTHGTPHRPATGTHKTYLSGIAVPPKHIAVSNPCPQQLLNPPPTPQPPPPLAVAHMRAHCFMS